jgi:Sodium/hydrogen exchanger family
VIGNRLRRGTPAPVDHHDVEILIGLLAAIAVLAEVARRLGVPYPIVLVLGGLVLGFVPGLAAPQLDPDVVFFLFLPPLLYSEAYLASTQALRRVAGEITLLAVGLVVATIVAVAVVAHEVAGMSWAAAFVLGAVVGPTDPVAATSVIRRLGVPERVATIIEARRWSTTGPRWPHTSSPSPASPRAGCRPGARSRSSSGFHWAASSPASSSPGSRGGCAVSSPSPRSR